MAVHTVHVLYAPVVLGAADVRTPRCVMLQRMIGAVTVRCCMLLMLPCVCHIDSASGRELLAR